MSRFGQGRATTAVIASYLLAVPAMLPWLFQAAPFDSARLLQTMLMAACTVTVARSLKLDSRCPLAVICLLALAALSIALAALPVMAAREAAVFVGLVSVAWAVARTPDEGFLAWSVVLATGLYAAIVLLLAWTTYASGMSIPREELFLGYSNRRLFNHVQTVSIALCVWVAASAPHRLLRRLARVAAALSVALLVLSAGRATALALACGLVTTWILMGKAAYRVIHVMATGTLAGLGLYSLIFMAWPLILDISLQANTDLTMSRMTSDQSRFRLWAWAWEAWLGSPWIGIGPMHLAHRFNGVAAHPHNLPLQVLTEWGLLVTALAGFLVFRAWRALVRAARHEPRGAGLVLMAVAVAVDACLSGSASLPVSQVWIAVGLGAAWRFTIQFTEPKQARAATNSGAFATMAIRTVLVVAPVALALDTASNWDSLPGALERSLENFPSPRLNPRFWSHGWF